MKKIIFIIFALFLIIFLIGLFFSQKENIIKIIKNEQVSKTQINQIPSLATSTLDQSNLTFTLELQKQINQEINKLTENLKPDENKSLSQYQKEIKQIQKNLDVALNKQDIKPEILINLAQELSSIKPPPIFYSFHLELIKTYYTLGLALQQFQQTDDPVKKILLYNLIKATLEKIKF